MTVAHVFALVVCKVIYFEDMNVSNDFFLKILCFFLTDIEVVQKISYYGNKSVFEKGKIYIK